MQFTLLLLALLATPAAAATASSAATSWLNSHKSPTEDQLKELAGSNPAAFAIVNALLAKHAKGGVQLAPEERGPDVFKRMMSPRHLSASTPSVAVPYATAELAEVSTPTVDQASYNPKSAADRDESSVSRLLAAVARMGGRKGAKLTALVNKRRVLHHEAAATSLDADATLFADDAKPQQAIELPALEEQKPAAPQKKENSYLKGIDLSGDMPSLMGTHSAVQKHFASFDGTNSLATFSFEDAAPAAAAAPKPVVAAPKPKKNNAFMDWLGGGVNKAQAPEEQPAAPVQPARKTNSYLDSVKFFG